MILSGSIEILRSVTDDYALFSSERLSCPLLPTLFSNLRQVRTMGGIAGISTATEIRMQACRLEFNLRGHLEIAGNHALTQLRLFRKYRKQFRRAGKRTNGRHARAYGAGIAMPI